MDSTLTTIGAAALAGVASVPHCAAMCGPLAMAACGGGRDGARATLRYGVGRLVMYGATGAVAGAAGARIVRVLRGEHVQQVLALAVALSLAVAALRLLRARSSQLVTLRARREQRVMPAFAAGLVTGLLPCGALASGLVLSASAATWWGGALAMLAFALSSAPGTTAAALAGVGLQRRLGAPQAVAWRRIVAGTLLVAAVWVAARPWWMPERRCHCHASVVASAPHPG